MYNLFYVMYNFSLQSSKCQEAESIIRWILSCENKMVVKKILLDGFFDAGAPLTDMDQVKSQHW